MKQQILDHLRNHKSAYGTLLGPYLREAFPTATQRLISYALQSLYDEQSIDFPAGLLMQVFNDEDLAKPMSDFQNSFDGMAITWQGERRWEAVEMMEDTKALNKSIRSLNSFQRFIAWVTAGVATASLIAIAASSYFSWKALNSKDIFNLTQQIKTSTAILDSVKQYQKGIDSSLRKIASDTSHRKTR